MQVEDQNCTTRNGINVVVVLDNRNLVESRKVERRNCKTSNGLRAVVSLAIRSFILRKVQTVVLEMDLVLCSFL